MLNLQTIHKPTAIADALELIKQPGVIPLAGGTALNAQARDDVSAVVDLSALGLSYIRESNGTVAIGAMTTLAMIEESPILRALANGVVAQAAHRSASSVLRNQATIAGTLISDPNGILMTSLLACHAKLKIAPEVVFVAVPEGEIEDSFDGIAIAYYLAYRQLMFTDNLVTEIVIPLATPRASLQTVARTPSDKPIVSAGASVRIENGIARNVRIVLGGIADLSVRALESEQALEGQIVTDALIEQAMSKLIDPEWQVHSDFRGSAEYRKEMAMVLARRAMKELLA